jgi:hypothetical protein
MALAADPALSGNTFTNNGVNGLQLDGGTLAANTAWNDPEVVYYLASPVTVPAGLTLTILPGQIVKLTSSTITIDGTLVADGTAQAPIIFTSPHDDSAGGDTNNDGAASSGTDFATRTIVFSSTSTGSHLSHVEARFFNGMTGGIEMNGVSVPITDSLITDSLSVGLSLTDSSPTLTRVTIANNVFGAAIKANLASNPVVVAPTLTNNLVNGLLFDSGTITSDTTWSSTALVYVTSGLTVAQGAVFTLAPGVVVKVRSGNPQFEINGTLRVAGTTAQPVVITSFADDTAGGDTNNSATLPSVADWSGIVLMPTSTANLIDHADVRYGGAGPVDALITVNDAPLTLKNSVLRNSAARGLTINTSNPTVTGNTFQNNAQAAIAMDLVSNPVFGPQTFSGNFVNGVELPGGSLPGDTTWNDPGVVYWLKDDITVPAGVKLTVGAQQIVKFADGRNLFVDGTLDARGGATTPIIFTSDSDDAAGGRTYTSVFNHANAEQGEWGVIKFGPTSTGNVLDRVEVRYGGGGSSKGMVTVQTSAFTLTNSILRDSTHSALRIEQSTPTITNDIIRGVTSDPAVSMDLMSRPNFSGTQLINSQRNHIGLDTGTLPAGTTTWDAGLIYEILLGRITVPAGATLNIAPGQIIKAMATNTFVQLDALVVNGTLNAVGTNEQPIIFTTILDDSAGGRSAGFEREPNQTSPLFWEGLAFTATSTGSVLDHVEVRNAGYRTPDGQPIAGVTVDGGTLTVRDSALLSTPGRSLLALHGANVTVTGTIITATQISSPSGLRVESGATLTATNNTIVKVGYGVEVDGAGSTATLKNNFIGLQSFTGVAVTNGGTVTASNNDIFGVSVAWDGPGDQTGTNGNISLDPLFANAAKFDFRPASQSPLIDAGTSVGAPLLDRLGSPRFDDPSITNTGAGATPFVDIGAFERQSLSTSAIDLTTTSVIFDVTTGLPLAPVNVMWTVQNIGVGGALGPWKDAIYLSPDPVWSPDDVLLGEQAHSSFLGAGSSYNASKIVSLPSVLPGNYYFIVRANSGNDVFEGQTLANNPGPSTTTIAMDLPSLQLGATFTTNLVTTGDAKFFKVTLPEGKDLSILLDGPAGAVNEIYARYGAMPSRQLFDQRGVRNGPDQSVSFGNTHAGDYYVLIYGAELTAEESVSLTASLTGFSITNVEPKTIGSGGKVTLTLSGAQFDGTSVPKLHLASGATLTPQSIYFSDSGLLAATFDVPANAVGSADVQVFNGAALTTFGTPITIASGGEAHVQTNLAVPTRLRLDRDYTFTFTYTNTGLLDAAAPIFEITSSKDLLSIFPDRHDASTVLDLVGLGLNYPAGILPPGASATITIYSHTQPVGGANEIDSSVAGAYTGALDWNAIGPVIRPAGLSDAEWNPLLVKLRQRIGETWESFRAAITNDASLFPSERGSGLLLKEVFALEVERAVADLHTSVSGHLFLRDAMHPAGNVELRLYDMATGKSFETVSLNDGTFTFPIVDPGSYEVLFSGFIAAGSPQVNVSANDVTGDFTITPGGVISGSVLLTPRGVPLRDVIVSASAADGHHFFGVTDSFGRFRIDSLPSGDYTLNAGGDIYSQANLTVDDLVAGSERAQVNFTVKQGGTISGVVKGPGNVPIAGATVSALGADGHGYSATSDATGAFTITSLAPQTYQLLASGAGLVTGVLDNVILGDAPLSGVNLALTHGGTLTGTITKSGGSPGAFDFVKLQLGVLTFSAQADSEGVFSLSGLPAGNYTLTVPDAGSMTATANATVVADMTNTAPPITLSPLGTISGLVTNTTANAPLGGVTVFVLGPDGVLTSDVTGADGRYTLTGIDAGSYSVVLGDLDTAGAARASVTLSPSATAATHNFSAAVSGVISGTIFKADGTTPAAGAIVRLGQAGDVILTRSADANGNYSFVVLASGSYEVAATADGLTYTPVNVNVSGGATTDTDFVAGTHTLSGTVRDAGNAVVPGATVVIYREGAESVRSLVSFVTADANGAFSITGLVDGSYRIDAVAEGLAAESAAVTIAGTNPAPVSFSLDTEATLHGTITDAATTGALTGANVLIVSRTAQQHAFPVTTDATGAFAAAHLLPGTYDVIVMSDGHRTSIGSVVIAVGDNTFDVALAAPSTTLSGHVADATGALAGVTVQARDANGFTLGEAETGANGAFSITSLAAGSYSLVVVAEGFKHAAAQPVTLTNGQASGGHDFTLQAAALSDPDDNASPAPHALGPEALLRPAWLSAILRSPDRDDNQPTSFDLAGLIDLVNCPAESQRAVQTVRQAENFFRNWEYAAEGSFTNLLREGASSFLQFTVAGGKILSVLNPAKLQAAVGILEIVPDVASVSFATFNAINNLLPILADYISYYTTFQENWESQTGDAVSFQGNLADIGVKLSALGTALAGVREAAVADAAKIAGAAGGSSAVTGAFKAFGKLFGIIDAGLSVASAVTDAVAGLRSVTGQVIAIQNAEKVYHNAVDNALGAISVLRACKAEHTDHDPHQIPDVDPFGVPKKRRGGSVPPPPPPPKHEAPNVEDTQHREIVQTNSRDPNDKHGPAGFGPSNFIQFGPLSYEVEFENVATAGANAQIVVVTDQLDPNKLDLDTFEFGEIDFGQFHFEVPEGLSSYIDTFDLRPDGINLLVHVDFAVNKTTGLLTARFESINPDTGQAPDGVDEGFLPPNNANHDGEGHFTYTVTPKASAGSGTAITNQASIVFDTNQPILTPTTLHTIDADAPTATINALGATTHSLTVPLSWVNEDGLGSGVATVDVYVSDNGGAFTLFLDDTTKTAAKFHGVNGHTYAFAVVATDNVGYVETGALVAETTTQIDVQTINFGGRTPLKFTDANGDLVTITLNVGTGQAILTNGLASGGDLDTLTLTGTTTKSALNIAVKKAGAGDGTTTFAHIVANSTGQSLKSITGKQAFLVNDADDPALSIDVNGSLGPVTIGGITNASIKTGTLGNLTTGFIHDTAIEVTNAAGNITAKLAKQNAPINVIDNVVFSASKIGNVTVSLAGLAGLTQGAAIIDSVFTATGGTIGKVSATVTTVATGFDLSAIDNTDLTASLGIGKITASAKAKTKTPLVGSTATALTESTIIAGAAQPIAVAKDLAKAGIAGLALTGAVRDSILAVKGSIGALSVTGDLTDSTIVAGVNVGADGLLLTADDTYQRHGSIASVKVTGAFARTSLIAGIDPGDDFKWGAGTGANADVVGSAIAGLANGKIGALTLGVATIVSGNTPFKTPALLPHDFAIEAQTLATIQVGKLRGPKPLPASLWLDADGDGTEEAGELLIARIGS